MTRLTPTNVAWRRRYGLTWRLSLMAALALHAGLFFLMPRAITDRLHEALIPPPDVSIVAGPPGTEMEVLALAHPAPPAETPPPEPEPIEEVEIPVVAETPRVETITEAVESPRETAGVERGSDEGQRDAEPAGGGGGSITPPRPVHLVVPRLPGGVDKRRARGETVHLLVEVLPDGSTGEVRVEKGSRLEGLDIPAVAAAQQMRFLPATRDGIAVKQWARVEMRF